MKSKHYTAILEFEVINPTNDMAMFFENRLKAQKFIRDKQLPNVQVCCVDINPYTI
jgi:hypothetical protein